MNGFGYYKHFSGYVYEGVFVNGQPVNGPTKLHVSADEFKSNEKFKIYEGKSFKITVSSKNENDELFLGWFS